MISALCLGCAHSSNNVSKSTAIPLEAKTPAYAFEVLKQGNERFVINDGRWEGHVTSNLVEHLEGQNPYAMIISCADSRVPVEHIFDAGFGELFVMRVAGNVATSEIIGSSEYAALALKTPLMVVLGHSACGAVAGSLQIDELYEKYPDDLQFLLEDIRKDLVINDIEPTVDDAVALNVRKQVAKLNAIPTFAQSVADGNLMIVGGVYNIGTGRVTFLE
ncbi:MAG: carbonic anhydrase [Sumerlaeia bacterium]